MTIDYVAVVVAAVVNFFIGFMLHGPVGGKLWMKLANIVPTGNEKISDMVPQMLWNLLANLVFAYVLAMVYMFAVGAGYAEAGLWAGLCVAFKVWIGFVVTSTSMDVIWMKANFKLWVYEIFASLASILAMGAIIAVW